MIEDSVVAREFVLVDRDDKPIAALKTTEDGSGAALAFFDQDGNNRVKIGYHPDAGPGVSVDRADGSLAITLLVLDDGNPGVTLVDKIGRQTLSLGFGDEGPALLLSRDDTVRIGLALSGRGPSINLMDTSGQICVQISQTTSDGPRLVVSDAAGQVIWSEPD